jgi:hypothetical protein
MCTTCWTIFMHLNSPCTYYELPWQITFWLKGETTLHPLKIVVTKTKNLHFFFQHMWTSHLGVFTVKGAEDYMYTNKILHPHDFEKGLHEL